MLLDYRYHYAVLMTEARFGALRRERSLERQLRPLRRLPEPRRQGPRRWSVADFLGRVVAGRAAR